jgi:hypothetical protein
MWLLMRKVSYYCLVSWGGVRLSQFGTSATNWPIVPAHDDRWWWMWSSRWNENCQGKPKYSDKTCPSANLSITNPKWPNLSSNPATNRLMTETQIQSEISSCEIRGDWKSTGTVFSHSSFGFITLTAIPPLPLTHISPPREACDIPDQAALHQFILSLLSWGASVLILQLAGYAVRTFSISVLLDPWWNNI